MLALIYDKSTMPWDTTRGLEKRTIGRPVLDPGQDPRDADRVIIKTVYAGFCGSDRGIWSRNSFKGMIFESLKRQRATRRVVGHEMVGEVVEVGERAAAEY